MSTAGETIADAMNGKGCLGKAAYGEPVFILRAQDKFAPLLVEFWALLVFNEGVKGGKAITAGVVAKEMKDWQRIHGCKIPD